VPQRGVRNEGPTAKEPHFTPALFRFFRELAANNRREWFLTNKQRYEREVREPLLSFIANFAPRLKEISVQYVADPSSNGRSMFRIYRDVRFSTDKRPYKTHAAAQFRHMKGKDVHAPGYYLHLEPGYVFFAAGMWHPDPQSLTRVRDAIAGSPKRWRRAIGDSPFVATCTLQGDKLSRPPKGYDSKHPLIEDLKLKDFIAYPRTNLRERDALSADFIDQFAGFCFAAAPLMRFLTEAVGLKW
jgi:uncharacterized protein (TIGR02453 family)